MSHDQHDDLSPVKRALLEMRAMRARVEELERARSEPVAIVGAGLRLPGGITTVDAYWKLLIEGTDAISEVPASRWDAASYHDPDPDTPGKIVTRFGGFIDRIDEFDAAFFGITPREAASMDPQQRLLLEVAWEALEHAGQAPDRLAGAAAGVFVGLSANDYLTTELKFADAREIDAYVATGGHPSVASGRLSYVLGLQGPSLTIDTACSSSLTAVHLAVQSLRSGECGLALAGGVSLMLLPELSVNFSRARMLAPDGRCKTFDARADGYVRSEGCALIVLKRLTDAVASGDRVLAVIKGTAVNQDGRSSGLTVPNGPAQEAVIREALRRAAVTPDQVDYVEAHGTGTELGDPVELRALGGVFAPGRARDRRLRIGSVKTNLGHLEAAAGVAGLIKVALALDRGVIPPHLHFTTPTPHVDFDALALEVPVSASTWDRAAHPRTAGVSAFGFSGTNAHIVLAEAPARAPGPATAQRQAQVLTVSAKTEAALRAAAARLSTFVAEHPARFADICHTVNTGRSHFAERAAIVARSADAARTALDQLAAGTTSGAARGSIRTARRPEIAFLFSGQGYEQAGMGRELFDSQPIFRRSIERCDEILRPRIDASLVSLLYGADQARLHEPRFTQPVLFAFGVALAELWRSWGVEPAFVAGHSLGEDIAACVAGVFSLEQGLEMVAARARVMDAGLPDGAMAAVFAPADEVEQMLRRSAIHASIAAINGREHVVVAGSPDAIGATIGACEKAGLKARTVPVPRACHSPAMDSVLGEIESLARAMTLSPPRLAFASTLTGQLAGAAALTDPVYWRRHVRETVRFSDALQSLYDAGARIFVDIGPNGSLTSMGRRNFDWPEVVWLSSLKRDGRDWDHILAAAAELYACGVAVDWRAVDAGSGLATVDAPTYPFQRQRYWSDAVAPRRAGAASRAWSIRGERIVSPALTGIVYQTTIGVGAWPPLADHRVDGQVRVPAALFLEQALAADECRSGVAEFQMEAGLVLEADERRLQLLVDDHHRSFSIVSANTDAGATSWTTHATGRFAGTASGPPAPRDVASIRARCAEQQTGDVFYAGLATHGLKMGPAFRTIANIWMGEREALARIDVPRSHDRWHVHPAVLDAGLQAVAAALPQALRSTPYLFVGLDKLSVHAVPRDEVFSHIQLESSGTRTVTASVAMLSSGGEVIAELSGVTFQQVDANASSFSSPWLHELAWRTKPAAANTDPIGRSAGVAIAAAAPALAARHGLDAYRDGLSAVDALAVAHIAAALRELALPVATPFTVAELCAANRVEPRYERLIARFVDVLAAAGLAERSGRDRWRLQGDSTANGVRAAEQAAAHRSGELPELTLTQACAPSLARVLRGDVDPLQLLFPGGSADMAARVYQESPAARTFNGCVEAAVARIIEELPRERHLRVLEIGAGTGATTSALLPLLPAERTRYVFTDVSPVFLQQAEEKFSHYPFVEYHLLDLERDAQRQGFAPHEFDLIIAVNVLHATADLGDSLQTLRTLLAPGGMMLISEATEARPWLDVTFGLTEGWWRSQDRDLRPEHPLLTRAQWVTLLRTAGFEDIEAHPQGEHRVFATQGVFLARPAATSPAAPWIVFADAGGVADAVAEQLRGRGGDCLLLPPGIALSAASVDQAFERAVADGNAPAGVLYLGGLDARTSGGAEAMQRAVEQCCAGALHVSQAMARLLPPTPMWMVTASAVATGANDSPQHPGQAALWGLARVLALEHPEHWGGVIDVAAGDPPASASRIARELLQSDGEDQIAWRGDQRLVARLGKCASVATTKVAIQPGASYLITGGLGRLGLELARWLVEQGATHLTLVSRRSPDAACRAQLDTLAAAGADVDVIAADVADTEAMRRVFAAYGHTRPALRGIIHAASAVGTARVADLDTVTLNAMLRPKVAGTCVVSDLAAGHSLDFFVLFSSTTGVFGSAFLAHYAAANSFLDSFAAARRTDAMPVSAVIWGAWENIEIASQEVRQAMARGGLRLMPVAAGMQALGRLLHPRPATVMVVDADWPALVTALESRGRRPFLREMAAPEKRSRQHTAASGSVRQRLDGAAAHERRQLLARHVLDETARALRIDPRELDPSVGLFDLGMDSLMSLDLRKRLESALDLKLPTTLTFNYPTIDAIVGFVAERLGIDAAAEPPPPTAPAPGAPGRAAPAAPTRTLKLDELSEEQLADLLTVKLEGLR